MSYRQVDMVNVDTHLKDLEFYTEYLKWKGNDIVEITGPTSKIQLHKRTLSEPEETQPNKRMRTDEDEFVKVNVGNLILQSHKTLQQIMNEKMAEYQTKMQERDMLCINKLNWSCISEMKDLGEGAWSKVSKAIFHNFNDCYKVAVKILDHDIEWEDPEEPIAMVLKEAIAMKSLENVRGVPKIYGITQEEPLALVMSYHKGDTLSALLRTEDVEGMLEAFIKICKTVRKMHRLGWAHNDIHLDNIMVHHGKRNKLHVTVIDYGLCRELGENPHDGLYDPNADLPEHLPNDAKRNYYEGDLADRFALCRTAALIAKKLTSSPTTDEFLRIAEEGCTTEYPHRRPSPKTMSRLANAALEGFRQSINQRDWTCTVVEGSTMEE